MRWRRGVTAAVVGFAALATASYVVRERTVFGWLPAHDIYAYFYPKMLYALASLRQGGEGLLWNPFQNCGQPFFAVSQTGLLYPPYLLFLVLDPEAALRGVLVIHVLIGGLGMYFLAREVGARPSAALLGMLAFQIGNTMVRFTVSSPTHCAPYAWLPVVMLAGERLLRVPSLPRAFMLAAALAVAILPGMPQTVFFTYQLLALRVLWELLPLRRFEPRGTAGTEAPPTQPGEAAQRRLTRVLGFVLLGLISGPLLAAVQLFPEMEVARESIRSGALTTREMIPQGAWGLSALRSDLAKRSTTQPLMLVPCLVAAAAFFTSRTRRIALFYGLAVALGIGLALGPGTPLFDLYSLLPGTGLFRQPARFLWIAAFCLPVLVALGAEALASSARAGGRGRAVITAAAMAAVLVGFYGLTPNGLTSAEWGAALIVVTSGLAALLLIRFAAWVPLLLLAGLMLQVVRAPSWNSIFLYPEAPPYFGAEPVFTWLRQRMGAEDRAYLLHAHPRTSHHSLMEKTASLFRVPNVVDYEPLVSQRFAEFTVMLRSGRPMRNRNEVIFGGPLLTRSFSRRLFDLTATRYLVVDAGSVAAVEGIEPAFERVASFGELAVFVNPQALPRVFFVPRVEVVPDPQVLLERLATGSDDLHQVAFVEETPPSGYVGGALQQAAEVRFTRNDPERLSLEVEAPARGFLVLSDQYFPGWFALVNGEPAPIQKANHVFRAVEVPPGRSVVELWYSPRSLRLGAAVSAATALLFGVLVLRKGSRVRGLEGSSRSP
jgi:hypothetical protein